MVVGGVWSSEGVGGVVGGVWSSEGVGGGGSGRCLE